MSSPRKLDRFASFMHAFTARCRRPGRMFNPQIHQRMVICEVNKKSCSWAFEAEAATRDLSMLNDSRSRKEVQKGRTNPNRLKLKRLPRESEWLTEEQKLLEAFGPILLYKHGNLQSNNLSKLLLKNIMETGFDEQPQKYK